MVATDWLLYESYLYRANIHITTIDDRDYDLTEYVVAGPPGSGWYQVYLFVSVEGGYQAFPMPGLFADGTGSVYLTDSYNNNAPDIVDEVVTYDSYYVRYDTGFFDTWSACYVFEVIGQPEPRLRIWWMPSLYYDTYFFMETVYPYYIPTSYEDAYNHFTNEINPQAASLYFG